MNNNRILLVGCGNMGGALLLAMLKLNINKENILVIEPDVTTIKEKYKIAAIAEFDTQIIQNFKPNLIIFAVKPQIIGNILADYKIFAPNAIFVSIIAGKTIAFFEQYLGENAQIVRTMPNLPVLVGDGMTVFFANQQARNIQDIVTIFSNIGKVITVNDEKLLDAVTAISGSGPAYLFHFIECLTAAAIKLGLSEDIAAKLANQTIFGSAALAIKSTDSATILRQNVTSPGGTTKAALDVLMQDNALQNLINQATKAACLRSQELQS